MQMGVIVLNGVNLHFPVVLVDIANNEYMYQNTNGAVSLDSAGKTNISLLSRFTWCSFLSVMFQEKCYCDLVIVKKLFCHE